MQHNLNAKYLYMSNELYEKELEITTLKSEVELLRRSYIHLENFYLSYIERLYQNISLQNRIQP